MMRLNAAETGGILGAGTTVLISCGFEELNRTQVDVNLARLDPPHASVWATLYESTSRFMLSQRRAAG